MSSNWPNKACVLQWHYVDNKSVLVQSGGECKQICTENISGHWLALLSYGFVIYYGGLTFIAVNKSDAFERT